MDDSQSDSSCCSTQCCRVDAVVSIDHRGQMVLPKEVRERAGITAGDKLAIVSWGGDRETCCISLVRAEQLTRLVGQMLGPMMKDLLGKETPQ